MSYTKRKLEELNVIDDFLMNSLASDSTVGEEFCRVLLSTLLQREIGAVKVTVQKVMPPAMPDLKGIRMDVKVEEQIVPKETEEAAAMNIYDIEPHLTSGTDFPRHNRFYQALTDSSNLKSGEKDYGRLPDLYILMILDKDPFGYDYMMYSVRNQCQEVKELEYNDGLHFYYFYTGGRKGGNESIRRMLRYIKDSRQENATDSATKQIHKFTEEVKLHPEVRKGYMFMEEYFDLVKEEIRKEVLEEELEEIKEKAWKKAQEEIREEARKEVHEEIRREFQEEIREEARNEIRETIIVLLKEYGEIPEDILECLKAEKDIAVLGRWIKLAAKADSMDGFRAGMQQN